jgi:hypothetical protein
MSRFAAMKAERSAKIAPADTEPQTVSPPANVKGRSGKKAISAYFSPDVSRGLHLLALEQGVSLQSLMGEAFDDLMRKYGRHPFGER